MAYRVSSSWLKAHMVNTQMRVLDATWHMPGATRTGLETFMMGHIEK